MDFTNNIFEETKRVSANKGTGLLNENIAIVCEPVLDPKGGHGAGVVSVDNEEYLKQIIANDPANGLNQYEFYPMRAVFKQS